MQDKNYIEDIDKQFTNSGWQKMRGMLDKEMPVTPAPKPKWYWWCLLLCLLFILAGTYYNFAIKNIVPTTATPDIPIANISENPQSNTTLEEESKTKISTVKVPPKAIVKTDILPSNTDIQTPEKTTDLTENTIQKINKKDIIENNLYINKKIYNNKENLNNNLFFNNKNNSENNLYSEVAGIPNTPVTSTVSSVNEVLKNIEAIPPHITSAAMPTVPMNKQKPIVSDLAPTKPPKENRTESTKRKLISTASVATLVITELTPQASDNQELIGIDPIPKARKFSQEYTWFAGASSDKLRGFGGATTGLLAHYRFTPKVGLETGLLYANVRKKIDTEVDYTDEVNALYADNTEQYRTIITNDINLHYLQIPLSVTYRPHPKVQFFTGVNVGYRLSKIFGNSNTFNDTVTTGESDNNAYDFSSEITINASDFDTINIPFDNTTITKSYSVSVLRMDLTAQAGIRYYPMPRLGIDLHYQQGLIDITKEVQKNLRSGVQLSLVYRLHR